MNVLIADALPEQFRTGLESAGHSCTSVPDASTTTLPEHLPGHEVLVVRSTKVDAAALAAAPELRLVIRAGSGTNTIDVTAAGELGIAVCNVPGGNATAVAELAFGLLLSLDRRIPQASAALRGGRWEKREYARARGISGRRIGVLGLGQIGMAFAERAAAFGASLYSLRRPDRSATQSQRAARLGMTFLPELSELAATCDVLSLHLPAKPETRGLIDARVLAAMPDEAILLNTARAELVDEQALFDAMERKGLRVGMDVFAEEPSSGAADFHSSLAAHPNVCGTPHIGASTEQAQQAIAEEILGMLAEFELGGLRNCVNPDAVAPRGLTAVSGGAG